MITRNASVEADGLLADVVGQGASRLAAMTRKLILEGAVPASILAIATELVFEGLERVVGPRHLLAERAR